MAVERSQDGEERERERGWPLWGSAIRDALDRQQITVNSAAVRLGLRNLTLKRWLEGEVPPQLSRLPEIAEITGISHAVQLELGNVLPAELRSEAHAIQVTDDLQRAISQVTKVVSRATELAFSDAGARLAGILLADSDHPLQITLRRAYRGNRYPVHLSTYVGVENLDKGNDGELLRQHVTKIIGQSARAFGARWREQDAHDWPSPRPNLILNVPQHERPKSPSSTAAHAVPNIFMLGCPYSHAEYIGAIIADALGYGYIDTRYSVPLALDRAPTDPTVTQARLQAEALRPLLPAVGDIRRPGSAAISLCWVACGRLDAFYEAGLQPWDFAAGALIASEAGVIVQGCNGQNIEDDLIIASTPMITADLSKLLIRTLD